MFPSLGVRILGEVNDDMLEMNAGTQLSFHILPQQGVFVKAFTERPPGFPGMQQADGHPSLDEAVEYPEERMYRSV